MLFNSYHFLFLFLPVVLVGFAVVSRLGPFAVKLWLTAASFFFYAWWEPSLLGLLLLSIGFNYFMGRMLVAAHGRGSSRKKALLGIGVVVNLAVLAYFKYVTFIIGNVTALTGVEFAIGAVVLPLAISFFTFQQIAYLADAAKGEIDDYGIVDYALFVSFFPQLIAGPIVHHREMMTQFQRERFNFQIEAVAVGIAFLILGLAKKVLIADNIDVVADGVFDSAVESPPGLIAAWTALAAFSLGIYFDFSGYSDMAIGLDTLMARLLEFGVPLSIWGDRWQKSLIWKQIKSAWRGPAIGGRDYVAAIQGAKLCLGMLSKGNRDLHTQRSAEIPYAGGLLCAERTSEHLAMYREGEEAVFWRDAEECARICHDLLNDDEKRERIRQAGRRRVLDLKIGNEDICRQIIHEIEALEVE